jgi:lipopolysaccharide transport system permease protein
MEKHIHHHDKGFRSLRPSTIWQTRELLFHLMKRDLLVTYKQTFLGIAWVALSPLAMALTIIFVFDHIGNFPNYGFPYILIALSALTCWEFFSGAISRGSICLVSDRDLIIRANFPRILLLINAAFKNFAGLSINLCLVFGFMLYFDIPFTFYLLFIPLILLATALLNLAVGLWLGTLNVFRRDINALVPFVLRFGLFISPIAFTLNSVPEQWRFLYYLNPLVAIIESMRFCILGEPFLPPLESYLIGGLTLLILFTSGLYLFGKCEPKFSDVI